MDAGTRDAVPHAAVPVDVLRRESRGLVQRLRLWTPARYAASVPPWGTRGEVVAHLAQDLADAAADREGQPRRDLPRLDSDLGLADQLAVTSDDLVRAGPEPEVARAAVAHLLLHRRDLLGDEVPSSLAAALGLTDVLGAGRHACATGRSAERTGRHGDGRPPDRGPAVSGTGCG